MNWFYITAAINSIMLLIILVYALKMGKKVDKMDEAEVQHRFGQHQRCIDGSEICVAGLPFETSIVDPKYHRGGINLDRSN